MFFFFLLPVSISEKYYFKELDYEKSYEQYKIAVKLEDTDGLYKISLGITLRKLKKYENTISQLKDTCYFIEDFYVSIGNLDESVGYFLKEKEEYLFKNCKEV